MLGTWVYSWWAWFFGYVCGIYIKIMLLYAFIFLLEIYKEKRERLIFSYYNRSCEVKGLMHTLTII